MLREHASMLKTSHGRSLFQWPLRGRNSPVHHLENIDTLASTCYAKMAKTVIKFSLVLEVLACVLACIILSQCMLDSFYTNIMVRLQRVSNTPVAHMNLCSQLDQ